MSEATIFTIAVLSLMLVSAILAFFVGLVWGREAVRGREHQAWSDGFNNAAGYEGKLEKLAKRRKWFGR